MWKSISFLFLIAGLTASCQNYGDLKKLQHLSAIMTEVSGITTFPNSNLVWMINDSGNANIVYGYEPLGDIVREVTITNAENIDWEDLTSDAKGNLYIGDFGNNANDREDLSIYTVENFAISEADELKAIKTEFFFEDQKDFPAKRDNFNFNVEALIKLKDNFYIFTKNKSKNFNGTTKLYSIPAKEGRYEAKLLDSYKTCDDDEDCFISSASLSADKKEIALLTFNKIFVLSNFKDDDFFKGDVKKIKLKHSSQKEGITFKNDSILYITDERRGNIGGNLYEYNLKK